MQLIWGPPPETFCDFRLLLVDPGDGFCYNVWIVVKAKNPSGPIGGSGLPDPPPGSATGIFVCFMRQR